MDIIDILPEDELAASRAVMDAMLSQGASEADAVEAANLVRESYPHLRRTRTTFRARLHAKVHAGL